MLGKNSAVDILKYKYVCTYFFHFMFFLKKEVDISCELKSEEKSPVCRMLVLPSECLRL